MRRDFTGGRETTYWLMNVQTKATVPIEGLPHVMIAGFRVIRFHPNGRQIVFVSDEGQNELWALDNLIPAQRASPTK